MAFCLYTCLYVYVYTDKKELDITGFLEVCVLRGCWRDGAFSFWRCPFQGWELGPFDRVSTILYIM